MDNALSRPEVMRGHIEDCVRHLAAQFVRIYPERTHGAGLAKKPLADFCGVTISAVTRWFGNPLKLPEGYPRIKLVCWLDAQGYRIIELERLSKTRRNCLELIGFGVITTKDAAQHIGYSGTSTLYAILRGAREASDDKDQAMWKLWKQHRDALLRRKSEVAPLADILLREAPVSTAAKQHPAHGSAALKLAESLLMMLDEGVFDQLLEELPGDERTSASQTILKLSARTNELCSRILGTVGKDAPQPQTNKDRKGTAE